MTFTTENHLSTVSQVFVYLMYTLFQLIQPSLVYMYSCMT